MRSCHRLHTYAQDDGLWQTAARASYLPTREFVRILRRSPGRFVIFFFLFTCFCSFFCCFVFRVFCNTWLGGTHNRWREQRQRSNSVGFESTGNEECSQTLCVTLPHVPTCCCLLVFVHALTFVCSVRDSCNAADILCASRRPSLIP